MTRFPRTLFVCLCCAALLSACSTRDFSDLDAFMEEKRAKPGGIITPIPTFKAYEAFSYSATTLRSPFERPIEVREIAQLQAVSAIKPDESRSKEWRRAPRQDRQLSGAPSRENRGHDGHVPRGGGDSE